MYRNTVEESPRATTGSRSRAAIIAIAPFVTLAAFVAHPHITFLPDANAVAHAVHGNTLRWAVAHWGVGIASALMAAAWVAVREHLRDAGENRWSAIALPFLAFAAATYAILPGMEFSVIPPAWSVMMLKSSWLLVLSSIVTVTFTASTKVSVPELSVTRNAPARPLLSITTSP